MLFYTCHQLINQLAGPPGQDRDIGRERGALQRIRPPPVDKHHHVSMDRTQRHLNNPKPDRRVGLDGWLETQLHQLVPCRYTIMAMAIALTRTLTMAMTRTMTVEIVRILRLLLNEAICWGCTSVYFNLRWSSRSTRKMTMKVTMRLLAMTMTLRPLKAEKHRKRGLSQKSVSQSKKAKIPIYYLIHWQNTITMTLDLNDGKNFTTMEWSMVFVKVPL